jgi:DNA helicase-2/ATP-dependent DNA helicase PcrA
MLHNRGLTPSQAAAVEQIEGPLLVLAGPGSGKTRVITRRIAHMIDSGIRPHEVLAITFTNKAAREMASRVDDLLPGSRVWVSTFHRFCARLLRRHAEAVGLGPNFTILDTSDQQQLVKEALRRLDIDSIHYPPGRIQTRISRLKNDLKTAEQFARSFEEQVGDHFQAVVARVYPEYQKQLLQSNAVDFDDLLLHVVTLLTENPELRSELDARFQYVLVDEYQDTNLAQYQIVSALSHDYPNLCVTGDPDQSIYGWRGAKIANILRFEADYPNAKVVRLEQNFRSTPQILEAADRLIAHNVHRKAKSLIPQNDDGPPVELLSFADGHQEAESIAADIYRQVHSGARKWSDFAIFYRVNALSREMELALVRQKVPYQVAAGAAFYDRAEIKDMLAYLRLVCNPADQAAFLRVVNTPARGIGRTTQVKLLTWAGTRMGDVSLDDGAGSADFNPNEFGSHDDDAGFAVDQSRDDGRAINLVEAAAAADRVPGLSKRAAKALKDFAKMIGGFARMQPGPVEPLVQQVIEQTGYVLGWRDSDSEQDLQRLANVYELLTAARQYDLTAGADASLEGFLEETSLASEVDNVDEASGRVTLMTLHAAKGLEFPAVYIIAVEQNLIPHERALRENDLSELEEERRLLFVGITRAQERLALTQTDQRQFRGKQLFTIPSDFIRELQLTPRHAGSVSWQMEVDELLDRPRSVGFNPREREPIGGADRAEEALRVGSNPRYEEQTQHEEPVGHTTWTPPQPRISKRPLLVTGSELLEGNANGAEIEQGFAVGMQVRHPQYGLGKIVKVSGFAKRRNVTVEFEHDARIATFNIATCPLQPVGLH